MMRTLSHFHVQKSSSLMIFFTGSWLVQMRRAQLHPSILGNVCMYPSIFRPGTYLFQTFRLIFSANSYLPSWGIKPERFFFELVLRIFRSTDNYRANLQYYCVHNTCWIPQLFMKPKKDPIVPWWPYVDFIFPLSFFEWTIKMFWKELKELRW